MPWRCTAWGRLALSPGLPTRSRAGADASPEWIPTRSQSAAMSCTGAKSYVGHALEMYGMGPPGFVTRFANEIARWSRCFPGMDTDEVAERSHELHRRHAAHVVKVLELGIQEHARELAERRLP